MATRNLPALLLACLRISGIALVCILWELLPRSGLVNPTFFPPLSAVLREIVDLLRHQHLLGHTVATLWRLVAGIVPAILLAVPAGAILGYWLPGLAASLNPLFRLLAQVNPFSLMTVFLLFFGIGEKAKLIIVTWVAFWPLLQHVINGVQNMDADLLKAARGMGTPPARLFLRVILPGAAPSILLGIRTSIILLLAILVAGEMLGGLAGLGWLLHWSSNYYSSPYATTPIFAVGLCISLIGVTLSFVLRKLERDLFFWKSYDSVWSTASATRVRQGRPNRYFSAAVLTAALLLLVAGGASTAHLSRTNGSFAGEGDVPRSSSSDHSEHMSNMPDMPNMPNMQMDSVPEPGHSGHSGHDATSGSQ
ncbi:ABC transporter permease [Paenibacillus sp. HN-1]|uniref:ABC transporter permease n=1 Tax=Paenibacillus TaxID=44249 RepID=UPI001CA7DA8C|nr:MULTISPECIES: ABC transporter permease [Paenibacillus]MBY9081743.1 ABC transporter permease [Paenibacillus sp. CGMCC 1.18879]MBY9083612.1 ABC transporter permease [Paenibacillus sinensis]